MIYYIPVALLFPIMFNFRLRRLCLFLSFLVCLLIGGIRYDVGYDYLSYVNIYFSSQIFAEPLSNLLIYTSRFFDRPSIMFMSFSFFSYFFVYLSAEKTKNYWVFLGYLCLPFYFVESFSLLRQSVALAICVYAYSLYLYKSKLSFIFIIIAALFHLSVLPFLLIFLCRNIVLKFNSFLFVLLMIAFAFFCNALYGYIIPYYSKLQFYSGDNIYGKKMFILCCALFVLGWIVVKDKMSKALFSVALCFSILSILVDAVFIRFVGYFFIPLIFINWSSNKYKSLRGGVILFFISLLVISVNIKSNVSQGPLLPYKTIFYAER